VESKTREKLREWTRELGKLDEDTKRREAEVWCLSALSILGQDAGFQKYLEENYNSESNG